MDIQERLQSAFHEVTVLRSRELTAAGISRMQVRAAVRAGLLDQAGRGLFRLPDADVTRHHSLVQVSRRVPQCVFCLLSALSFHQLTTQLPFQVWIAVGHNAWRPKLDFVGVRVIHLSGPALHEGVEEHVIEGVTLKVFNPAKTVADCFKFRNKFGLDVAIEALRDTIQQRRATMDELVKYARICRVQNVMQPYLECVI